MRPSSTPALTARAKRPGPQKRAPDEDRQLAARELAALGQDVREHVGLALDVAV